MIRKYLILNGILMTLLFSSLTNAQSGRRPTLPPPTPTPVPETVPTPKPGPEDAPVKAIYSFQLFRNIQFTIYNQIVRPENIQDRVAERLRKSSSISVQSRGESNRKEAINDAKESEETHVILLTLSEEEYMNPQKDQNMGKLRIGRVWVQFDVFAPKTGKSISSGTAYLDFDQKRGVWEKAKLKRCYPGLMNEEELVILEVGYEIADRIMSKFNVPIPQNCK